MRRTESRKSYSWWWDCHISPGACRWLQETHEQMKERVKRMLNIIEVNADSFEKRVELYYKYRPEMISLLEDFYRMYRSLAERYDHVTGELRKNIPSGKEGDESSSLDSESESESDDSSINNYWSTLSNDDDQGLRRKVELRSMKEKLRIQQEDIESSIRGSHVGDENLLARIAGYEEDLRNAKEKIQLSEQEISRLRIELQKYESGDHAKKVDELSEGQEAIISDKESQENTREEEPLVLDPRIQDED